MIFDNQYVNVPPSFFQYINKNVISELDITLTGFCGPKTMDKIIPIGGQVYRGSHGSRSYTHVLPYGSLIITEGEYVLEGNVVLIKNDSYLRYMDTAMKHEKICEDLSVLFIFSKLPSMKGDQDAK